MFNQTRIRLTALNAIVFFIILTCFSLIVYTQLRHHLFSKVDASLAERIQERIQGLSQLPEQKRVLFYRTLGVSSMAPDDAVPGTTSKTMIQMQSIDPRIFLVLWDDQGRAVPLPPIMDESKAALARFGEYKSADAPQTVTIGGHVYRTYAVAFDSSMDIDKLNLMGIPFGMTAFPSDSPTRITTVQAIGNVDSEQNMLANLLKLIVFGVIIGGAVTVMAGFFLANKALLPIRKSWDKQRQFVADASHELRNPLAIIHANAELVFRHPDRTILDMSEPIAMVLHESKRMSKLTDQLLTLARTDSDQEELLIKSVPLEPLLLEVTRKFAPLAETKQIRLTADPAPDLTVRGDSERLHQLLVILLDNSLKHTPDNGTIRVSSRKYGHHVTIVVKDTGAGISEEDLPHIFDRFYRGDKARNRSDGSTGLGLAIARWIVDKHGGTISAESRPSEGTTMTVQLREER